MALSGGMLDRVKLGALVIVIAALVGAAATAHGAEVSARLITTGSAVAPATPPAVTQAPYTQQTALASAMLAAQQYWGTPACGTPQDIPADSASLQESTEISASVLQVLGATAAGYGCQSLILDSLVTTAPADPVSFWDLCQVVAHEWGHLVEAPGYFAVSNPSDPNESPDPDNIMFEIMGEQTTPQCLGAMNHTFRLYDRVVTVHARLTAGNCHTQMFYRDRPFPREVSETWPCKFTDVTQP